MSMWWRTPLLSLAAIFAAIGGLGGFDTHHFREYFEFAGTLVLMFWGVPIVLITLAMIWLERLMGKYGRYVMTLVCAAPGIYLYVLFLRLGGDAHYVLPAVAGIFL